MNNSMFFEFHLNFKRRQEISTIIIIAQISNSKEVSLYNGLQNVKIPSKLEFGQKREQETHRHIEFTFFFKILKIH